MMTIKTLFVILVVFVISCGGIYCPETEPEQLEAEKNDNHVDGISNVTVGPNIGHIEEAVDLINSLTCNFISLIDEPPYDVAVLWSESCNGAQARGDHITILSEGCWSYQTYGLGIAVHELFHILGVGHDDTDELSLMHPIIYPGWEIRDHHIDHIKDVFCGVKNETHTL